MGRFLRSDQATGDLLDIWIHVKTTQSEARATTLIRSIERKLRLLSNQPYLGRPREEYHEGLRSLPVPPYVVFYLPRPDGITVIRVLHGYRDLDAVFDDDPK